MLVPLLYRSSNRPSRLEAFSAEHWPSLRRFERNGRLFPALRASRLRFRSNWRSAAASSTFSSFRFARFAPLGLVLESLVGEKHLFASSEYKFGATLRTLQYLIVEFHGRLPWPGRAEEGEVDLLPWAGTEDTICARGHQAQIFGPTAKSLNVFPTFLPDWGLIPEVRRRAASPTVNPARDAASCAVASAKALP